jgi:hypothetical protein
MKRSLASPPSLATLLGRNIWAALVPSHDIHFLSFNFARQLHRFFDCLLSLLHFSNEFLMKGG